MAAAALLAAPVVAGQALNVVGTIQESQSKIAAAEYNAGVASENANQTRIASNEQERQFRVSSRKQLGQMRANYSASGVTLEGSPLDVLEESAMNAELDALQLRHGGEVKARAFENEMNIEKFKAKQAKSGMYLGAGGALLSGISTSLKAAK